MESSMIAFSVPVYEWIIGNYYPIKTVWHFIYAEGRKLIDWARGGNVDTCASSPSPHRRAAQMLCGVPYVQLITLVILAFLPK
jgi:hypothetical protein